MEDECHKLDLEMACIERPQTGDRQVYIDYATIVHNERDLLDEKARIEGDLTWLFQTLTVLTLNSSNPTTDPQIVSVAIVIGDRRKRQSEIVSKHNHAIYAQNTQNL